MITERMALGTVQFGMDYGIANNRGRPAKKEIFDMLSFAHKEGIDTIDTAYSYGVSEEVIGDFTKVYGKSFRIISKTPNSSDANDFNIEDYLRRTLDKLGGQNVYGYLIHNFNSLSAYKGLWDKMVSFRERKLVKKIGVSLYNTSELDYLLENNINVDIIQVPYSVFDQRFDKYFMGLKKAKVEIYARSVFLQGLFFLDDDKINGSIKAAKDRIRELRRISKDNDIPIHALCLSFVLLSPFLDKAVIGVDSLEQLKQNIDSLRYLKGVEDIYGLLKPLECSDEDIILPYRWK